MDKELAALLNRAAAALETPADLTAADRTALIEDLVVAAESGQERYPRTRSATFLWISTRDALEALRRGKSPAWQTLSTRYARAAADVAQELAGDEGQVLILDDVLVNTDPVRQERILDVLGTLAERIQLLILTCHPDRYRGVGEPVCFASSALACTGL